MLRWADRSDDAEGQHGLPPMARGPQAIRETHTAGRALLFADMLEQWGEPPADSAYPTYDWMEGPRWWPEVPFNVWLGTSIENRRYVSRADTLRETPAAVRFISAEPLLGPLVHDQAWGGWTDTYKGDPLDLHRIDWLIVGGESDPEHRPVRGEWIRDLRAAAKNAHTRSSSSSGAAGPRRPAAGSSTAARGTRCRPSGLRVKRPEGGPARQTVRGKTCPHCGAHHNDIPGRLAAPDGRSWPLIGNGSLAAERQMVKAIIEANSPEKLKPAAA